MTVIVNDSYIREPRIHVVGIGMDGCSGLSPQLQALIQQATLLVGGDRHLSYFPDHPAPRISLGAINNAFQAIRAHLSTDPPPLNPCVIILASGDPLFFGIGRLILTEFPKDDVAIHPHLSAIQLAFSRIKEPWHDAQIISAHGRSLEQLHTALEKSADKIAVLTDSVHSPDAIARLVLALDRPHHYCLWVCENLGSDDETVHSYAPADLAAKSSNDFAPLNVVILLHQSNHTDRPIDPAELPIMGIPDTYFASFSDRPGLMTKREIRILILSELALKPDSVLWDIGAGTGSVSIEAARLCPQGTVYAIEKTAAGIRLIHTNMHRFRVENIHPIHGIAPQSLSGLPQPHHIFIGGSGGELPTLLNTGLHHLAPGGTLVLALATLEHLAIALNWLDDAAIQHQLHSHQLLTCQLSRSVPVGKLTRLAPLNPVNILTLTKSI